jgi:hypothetical protein
VKLPAVEGYPAVSSVSSYGQETSYEFPGVGGIIKLIHTHDGAIQVSLLFLIIVLLFRYHLRDK